MKSRVRNRKRNHFMHCTLNRSNEHKVVNGSCHKRQSFIYSFFFVDGAMNIIRTSST